ncbi:MAG: translation initiation factor IF-2 [Candidatus Hydrogenedentes bacterium]|nr:translation initiation factor IF-2 [Candidatus Hydrogenedentota bacterium]
MQTVSSLADRLDVKPEWAIERLRYMFIDVDDVESVIGDEACDLLIEVADDPAVADRVRDEKLKEIEKEKKKKEKLRQAAKKSAETRKKAAAKKKAASAKKAASKKTPAKVEAGDAEDASAPASPGIETGEGAPEAHPVVEIIRGEPAESVVSGEVLPADEEKPKAKKKKKGEPPKKREAEEKGPSIVIGAAVEKEEPAVEVVRADGTHVEAKELELVESEESLETDEEDTSGLLAEAERRQEEEEARRAKAAARPVVKPDPAVVAEVQRKAAERLQKLQAQRAVDTRKGGGSTGKTARKRQKRAEKQRNEENLRRDAAAAVRVYAGGGLAGPGARKRKRKRGRDEGVDMDVIEEVAVPKTIEVEEGVTVEELASRMDVSVNDIILDLMDLDVLATKNQTLGIELVRKIAEPKGFEVQSIIPEEDQVLADEPDDPDDLQPRAPVITVMGHVDHGKTSFLDRVRAANVAEGEAGGITQHIAAYDVRVSDKRVVFLDTPGHEAFTQMRSRGAQATDIVVLVVAADDGVMPQTIEAIDHAKAAEVPIVVAINKIDKPDAQPDRIRQELTRFDLVDEAWGGKTIIRNISAKTGDGIEELLELLGLQAELLELKANPDRRARGLIIESEISRGQGPVAWVLVQKGTLRVGDIFLAGETFGRVRSIHNSRGESVTEAGPATPVVVTGFSAPPDAGDHFAAVEDERAARAIAEKRADLAKQKQGRAVRRVTLEDFHEQMMAGEKNVLNVLVKADVQGSVDVLESSLVKVGNQEVEVKLVHTGVGGINESDVLLASASDAVIIGFHVGASPRAQKLAEQEGVDIRTYRVIYEAIEDVRLALEGMLAPESKEVITGHVEIRQVFRSSSFGNIAGCYVLDGEVQRGGLARLLRDDTIVYAGKIATLRREKDDARTVSSGYECGIKLDSYEDIKPGDIIETYRVESVAKTLA